LSVNIGSIFQPSIGVARPVIFRGSHAVPFSPSPLVADAVEGRLLTPPDFEGKLEPYLFEVMPGERLSTHFFAHKGEELGYLLSGTLKVTVNSGVQTMRAGDLVYLTSETPSSWENPGSETARILWIKVK